METGKLYLIKNILQSLSILKKDDILFFLTVLEKLFNTQNIKKNFLVSYLTSYPELLYKRSANHVWKRK